MSSFELVIRPARSGDAQSFFLLDQQLRRETDYLLLQGDEGMANVEAQREAFDRLQASTTQAVFVAYANHDLVGFVGLTRGAFAKNRHCASLVIAVQKSVWRRGVGTRLMHETLHWAEAHGVRRLELTVAAENQRAISLYKRCGFREEGRRLQSLCIDGCDVDELYMAVCLPGAPLEEAP